MCQLFANVKGHFHGNHVLTGCSGQIWRVPSLELLFMMAADVSSTIHCSYSFRILTLFLTFRYLFADLYDMFFKIKIRVANRCFLASQITMNAC